MLYSELVLSFACVYFVASADSVPNGFIASV